jgi:hypothetical protein
MKLPIVDFQLPIFIEMRELQFGNWQLEIGN